MMDLGTYLSFCDMLAFLFLKPGKERESFLREVQP